MRSESSLTAGLRLLSVFADHGPTLGVSQVARITETSKTTAYRRLADLERAGFLERDGVRYRLSWHLFELGTMASTGRSGDLRAAAAPWLTYLHVRSGGDVAHLAVLDGTDVLYLDRVSRPGGPAVGTAVGMRRPATCAGLGKAILAFSPTADVTRTLDTGLPRQTADSVATEHELREQLRRARTTGVATDLGETEPDVVCVASPILHAGAAVGAVSIASTRASLAAGGAPRLVRTVAGRISAELVAARQGG